MDEQDGECQCGSAHVVTLACAREQMSRNELCHTTEGVPHPSRQQQLCGSRVYSEVIRLFGVHVASRRARWQLHGGLLPTDEIGELFGRQCLTILREVDISGGEALT